MCSGKYIKSDGKDMERRFERGIGRSTEKKKNNVSRGGIKSPEKINYDD